jgi:hypothetical protein
MLIKFILVIFILQHTFPYPLEFDISLKLSSTTNKHNIYLEQDEETYLENDILRLKEDKHYILNIKIGQPSQNFELVLDTGSCMTWLGENSASGLNHRKKYNTEISKYFLTDKEPYSLEYDAGEVTGYLFKDVISLDGVVTSTGQRMKLLAVTGVSMQGQVSFDGVIGLARIYDEDEYDCKPEFSFITYLLDVGVISHEVFSFKSFDEDKGKLYVGDYHTDFNGDYKICKVISSEDDPFLWTCRLTHLITGDYTESAFDDKALRLTDEFTIDSGSPIIDAPFSALEYFEKTYAEHLYKQGCEKVVKRKFIFFLCPDDLSFDQIPSVYFFFDNSNFLKISPKYLFIPHSVKKNKYQFVIFFYKASEFWVAGQPIFYENHILFDMEKQLIAFKNLNSQIIKEDTEDKILKDTTESFIVDYIVLGVLAIIVLSVLIMFAIRRKKSEKKLTNINLNKNLL